MKWDVRKFGGVFVTATLIALGVRLFIVEDFRISSDSMSPSLVRGDLVLASKLAYNLHLPFSNFELVRFQSPQPGEVVVFSLPEEGMKTFVKRVVAVEGDTVEIKDGVLFINGKPLVYEKEADALEKENQPNGTRYTVRWDETKARAFGPVDVPKDHFFVLGDNRNESLDSRRWGPIPRSCLKGKVKVVWFSLDPEKSVRWKRVLSSVK